MAHKVIKESTHIIKKVLTGVVTGVMVTVILYFLFNKKPKASEAEVRKVTISTWKEYINEENKIQTEFDSSFAKVQRETFSAVDPLARNAAINAFCKRDSNTGLAFSRELSNLKSTVNLDQDFVIFLNTRQEYSKQMTESSLRYNRTIQHIMDSAIQQNVMAEMLQESQRKNKERMNNITVRIGRNIDYFADVLSNKYQYLFAASDLTIYYGYRALRRSKRMVRPDGVAPADPAVKQ